AGWCVGLRVFNREQVKLRVLCGLIEIAAFAGEHALEAKRRTAAAIFRLCRSAAAGDFGGAHPVEAIKGHNQAAVTRPPPEVSARDERILRMGGDDVDIGLIEGDKLEFVRARTHPIASLASLPLPN